MHADEAAPCPSVHLSVCSRAQACAVAAYAVQHILFAKGQVDQPIAALKRRRQQREEQQAEKEPYARHSSKARRSASRVDELLQGSERLHQDLVSAVDLLAHEQQGVSSSSRDVTLLLRMGQSPLALAKQEYTLYCKGILDLAKDTGRPSGSAQPPERQVLGRKVGSATRATAQEAKLQALERKLVRFLLSASMEENALGKALSTPIAQTRTQVFLCAPQSFAQEGWIPKRFLKTDARVSQSSSAAPEWGREERQATEAREEQGDENTQQLYEALSPLKRTGPLASGAPSLPRETHRGPYAQSRCAHSSSDARRAADLVFGEGDKDMEAQKGGSAQDSMSSWRPNVNSSLDEKRLARLHARRISQTPPARLRRAPFTQSEQRHRRKPALPPAQRACRTVQAAILLDFSCGQEKDRAEARGPSEQDVRRSPSRQASPLPHDNPRNEAHMWFAHRSNLRGCTTMSSDI